MFAFQTCLWCRHSSEKSQSMQSYSLTPITRTGEWWWGSSTVPHNSSEGRACRPHRSLFFSFFTQDFMSFEQLLQLNNPTSPIHWSVLISKHLVGCWALFDYCLWQFNGCAEAAWLQSCSNKCISFFPLSHKLVKNHLLFLFFENGCMFLKNNKWSINRSATLENVQKCSFWKANTCYPNWSNDSFW